MAKEKLMDFELLNGTHTTQGTPGFRDKLHSKTYVKQPNGPAVYVKDHRDLVEIFPEKFRRIYPEQIAQLAKKLNPVAEEQEDSKDEDEVVPVAVPLPGLVEGSINVTEKFPTAVKNDMKVFHSPDGMYTVVDEDGSKLIDGLKGIIQVRKWLKDNAEDGEAS